MAWDVRMQLNYGHVTRQSYGGVTYLQSAAEVQIATRIIVPPTLLEMARICTPLLSLLRTLSPRTWTKVFDKGILCAQ